MEEPQHPARPRHRRRRVRIAQLVAAVLFVWLVAAYAIIPVAWERYARRHPDFTDNPRVTHTRDHHPGDPLNVALIGAKVQLESIMKLAKWRPATALSFKSDLKIAADTVLARPYEDAPVSNLYLFGRKEDLAFEQLVGDNPRHRHHVRLWKTARVDSQGRPQWIGSAVYDERVGISRATGQITHVTASDVDAERDYLFRCLKTTGELAEQYSVDGFHKHLEGRNGGGDLWRTDGALYVGVIADEVR